MCLIFLMKNSWLHQLESIYLQFYKISHYASRRPLFLTDKVCSRAKLLMKVQKIFFFFHFSPMLNTGNPRDTLKIHFSQPNSYRDLIYHQKNFYECRICVLMIKNVKLYYNTHKPPDINIT